MTRYVEETQSVVPEQTVNAGDMPAWQHWNDGVAGKIIAARLVAFNPTDLEYQDVILDDASGGVVISGSGGGGSGGTEYDEDTAHTAGEKLTMAGVVRKDTAATLVGADSDRTELIVDADGKLWVNVGTVAVTDNGGSLTVDGSVTIGSALPAGTNNIGDVDVLSSALPTGAATSANQSTIIGHVDGIEGLLTTIDADTGGMLTSLQTLDNAVAGNEFQCDVLTLPAIPAGTNNIGDVDVASIAAGSNLIGRVQVDAQTGNGLSTFRSLDLDETEEQIKASAGAVFGWYIANLATSTRFVKFYNDTAANVTVGTTTPVITLPIPGNSTDDVAANALGGHGIVFSTAITVAATTGVADADTGAPAANDVVINVFYL